MSKHPDHRLRLPRPELVLAAIAVFVALAGTATAAGTLIDGKKIKKGTIAAKQLKKNAVTAKAVKKGAIGSAKLAAGAVTTEKIADKAVTGAKVDEASLGKVPLAAAADSAKHADTAGRAAEADKAANATALEGKSLGQVRPTAAATLAGSGGTLDKDEFEVVMSRVIDVPAGGAMVVANGSVELSSNAGGQISPACRITRGNLPITPNFEVTLSSGFITTFTMTGAAETGAGAQIVQVRCRSSLADGDTTFNNGTLTVQVFPTA